ncbi:hypothetical protein WDZ16_01810 [Pseudokineococcus marinus]|uniref:Lipoprotein n=1 Tax=Pseudokineococcus marinus TaxID=351215 RepID=A0A849BLS7_9ACTN|nr:hypothetical protein [Pseudokineococcus marinus]NNH24229.1 hypothetical protein [Pseudokineococcus marinus]
MTTRTRTRSTTAVRRPLRGLVAVGGAAALALGLGACGDTAGDEDGTSVEDVNEAESEVEVDGEGDYAYDGLYDTSYADQQDDLIGQEVTLSASVDEVLDDTSFTIAGDGSGLEPLLVVDAGSDTASMVQPDQEVDVSGTVEEVFVLTEVEADLGVDLDDELYAEWEGQTYLSADAVDVGVEEDS